LSLWRESKREDGVDVWSGGSGGHVPFEKRLLRLPFMGFQSAAMSCEQLLPASTFACENGSQTFQRMLNFLRLVKFRTRALSPAIPIAFAKAGLYVGHLRLVHCLL
jgi:hypothetical protein